MKDHEVKKPRTLEELLADAEVKKPKTLKDMASIRLNVEIRGEGLSGSLIGPLMGSSIFNASIEIPMTYEQFRALLDVMYPALPEGFDRMLRPLFPDIESDQMSHMVRPIPRPSATIPRPPPNPPVTQAKQEVKQD